MEGNMTLDTTTSESTTSSTNSSHQFPDYGPIHIIIPVVFGLICLLGVVGNSLVIYVILKHNKMKTVANVYILSLAIADLFFMFTMPFIAYQQATFEWPFGFAWCKVVMAVDGLNQTTGIYCLTAMAIDRYLAIVHPIRSMKIRSIRVATIVNVSSWFLSAITVMPLWLYTKTNENESTGVTVCTIVWPYDAFQTVFCAYMFILGLIGPLFIISGCYMLMIKSLYTGVAPLGQTTTKKKPAKKVARMVLTVIFVFVVCWSPFYIVQFCALNKPDSWIPSKAFSVGFYFSLCLSYFNSSINPVIYSFMSENFRKCFTKVLSCKRIHDIEIEADTKLFTAARDSSDNRSTLPASRGNHKTSTAQRT
ncbi:somatostatin receptor type 2-like [Glandiceps talaboti]